MKRLYVLVPAAGTGTRFGADQNKLFVDLCGQPVWTWTLGPVLRLNRIERVVLASSSTDRSRWNQELRRFHEDPASSVDSGETAQSRFTVVDGGRTRTDSVIAMMAAIVDAADEDLVAIHDAARPLCRMSEFMATVDAADRSGAAVLASPIAASLHRRVGDGSVPVDRNEMFAAATPQVFRVGLFRRAIKRHNGRPATDDATLVSRTGHPVTIVPGGADNLKITVPEDLAIAAAILANRRTDDHTTPQ